MAIRYLDLRLCIIVLINMVKSPQFQIVGGGISWTNLFSFLLVLAVFSCVSIEVPLTLTLFSSTCSFHVRLRFGNRPVSAAASFMASLILPQPVFLRYVYPVILLLYFHPSTARLVDHALRSLRAVIPINQLVYDIFITTTTTTTAAAVEEVMTTTTTAAVEEVMNEQENSDTPDLEANIEAAEL